jgi:hypothetical protein
MRLLGDDAESIRTTLSATGLVSPAGKFEIIAITVGEGNGWKFGEAALMASMDLWDGVECFVDHGGWFGDRSVKDLGGVCKNPRWSTEDQGIMLDLQTIGPSGKLIEELGRELLAEDEPKPKVGFSADVLFTAKGREITNILRVLDLSMVFNPARGGAFVRAMNSVNPKLLKDPAEKRGMEVTKMPDNVETIATTNTAGGSPIEAELKSEKAAIEELRDEQEKRERLAAETEEARQVRVKMCAYLLDSGLNASGLPEPMREHVRGQLEGSQEACNGAAGQRDRTGTANLASLLN